MNNNITKWNFLATPKFIAAAVIMFAAICGLGAYGRHVYLQRTKVTLPAENIQKTIAVNDDEKDKQTESKPNTSTPEPSAPNPGPKTGATKPSVSVAPATPPPAPTPAPQVNTTNCLPPNPSPYATHYITMNNSQYLQTNGYANTTKLYAALQFAGLIDTINTKQYVVLAMDDAQWNFTQAQLDWMNASPANMRAVLGWQIITSCITWNGINPVKDMAAGTTRTVNTLNGTVTYTSGGNGPGTFGSGGIGIWDWFTSNGSVTIAGFVNTTAIP
jgi:hypothetical protein